MKKTRKLIKKKSGLIILFLLLIINSFHVISQPLVPITIEGFVFLESGTGAPNGVPVIVNNTDINRIFTTEVDAPPVPALRGIYSLAIEGDVGHELIVRAHNDTHYGETIKVLTSTSATQINVTMNISRPAELLVNITSPLSDSVVSPNSDFNVSVNITSIINDASNCEAVLSISDKDVVDVKNTNTNNIASILKDQTVTTIFELESYASGSSNIGVVVTCESDGVVFEGNNEDEVTNITVIDDEVPLVTIVSPENNTIEKSTNNISFVYVVEDASPISECRLFINETLIDEHFDVLRNVEQTFSINLDNDYYAWEIECDDPSLTGSSGKYYLDVSVFYPVITNIGLPEIINLNPGNTKEVLCEVTVEDLNGAEEISSVEALLHLEGVSSFFPDNNFVYADKECALSSSFGNTRIFSCSFDLEYYADNGTWLCNATSLNNYGLSYNNFNFTLVDELYAINVSSLFIEYGDVPAGTISGEESLDVFNVGNMPLTVFVKGYGAEEDDDLSMVCDNNEEIPVSNQRFFDSQGEDFSNKNILLSSFTSIISNLAKQTTSTLISQSTFWQMQAPPMELTSCEGTIIFSVSE